MEAALQQVGGSIPSREAGATFFKLLFTILKLQRRHAGLLEHQVHAGIRSQDALLRRERKLPDRPSVGECGVGRGSKFIYDCHCIAKYWYQSHKVWSAVQQNQEFEAARDARSGRRGPPGRFNAAQKRTKTGHISRADGVSMGPSALDRKTGTA
jgi:hypothetical protein